jgi:hypothetical protein
MGGLGSGRARWVDIPTGARFGRWTVLGYAASRGQGNLRRRYVSVRCDCGAEHEVVQHTLRGGKSRGCQRCKVTPVPKSDLQRLYEQNGRSAGVRGHEWAISLAQFTALVTADCHYCGEPPKQRSAFRFRRTGNERIVVRASGIDRVDSSRGYVDGNCVPCCWECNTAKNDQSQQDHINRCRRVAERHSGVTASPNWN